MIQVFQFSSVESAQSTRVGNRGTGRPSGQLRDDRQVSRQGSAQDRARDPRQWLQEPQASVVPSAPKVLARVAPPLRPPRSRKRDGGTVWDHINGVQHLDPRSRTSSRPLTVDEADVHTARGATRLHKVAETYTSCGHQTKGRRVPRLPQQMRSEGDDHTESESTPIRRTTTPIARRPRIHTSPTERTASSGASRTPNSPLPSVTDQHDAAAELHQARRKA